jgi:hypothetical protein
MKMNIWDMECSRPCSNHYPFLILAGSGEYLKSHSGLRVMWLRLETPPA